MSIHDLEVNITEENAGNRIDHFLAKHFGQFSRAYLQKQIEKKQILLNRKKTRKGVILQPGDAIQIQELLELHERRPPENPQMTMPTVYMDDELAVIEKPAGVPTHPVNHEETDTVVNWWIAQNPSVLNNAPEPLRAGIVHRLDTDTSGLLILAKNQENLEGLQEQFRQRKIKKEYQAIVFGNTSNKGEIDFPLAHDPKSKRRMMAIVKPRDKVLEKFKLRQAKTAYQVLEKFDDFTLLKVQTYTGRMHQVRVHLAAIGHPLVGDVIYRKGQHRSVIPQLMPQEVHRHFLHASFIGFRHPKTQKEMSFTSNLPEDMEDFLNVLRKN